ncbi:tetratricopeptide repeat protein [Shouchella patagoniensis]|uniref:tetratricopeptide repeat protein n=1 Tax=Shouchella patagoniensis TaxID=228576 RepID=UPI000995A323|nr:tetratricopeptide repeat protein [Shouchella patagoniensis]
MDELESVMELRGQGNWERANKELIHLIKRNQEDGWFHYLYASNCDMMGLEEQALPYFKAAIRLGLEDADLKEAYLGLGSSYLALDRHNEAEEVLYKGSKRFPECEALKVFYAMALHTLERYNEAAELLLSCIVRTSSDESIRAYKEVIYYNTLNSSKHKKHK